MYFTYSEIDNLIKEDVPYIDLTSTLLGISNQEGILEFRVRKAAVVACTEEVVRIFEKLGLKVIEYLPSGTFVEKGTTILIGEGKSQNLHMAWKVSLNVLEYCLGVATSAKRLIVEARKVSVSIILLQILLIGFTYYGAKTASTSSKGRRKMQFIFELKFNKKILFCPLFYIWSYSNP